MSRIHTFLWTVLALFVATPAFAAEDGSGLRSLAAALAISVAAVGGALGQGKTATAALEGLARNPEAKVTGPMIIGLALIESLVIYAFVIAILLV